MEKETTSAKAYGNLAPFLWERMAPAPVTLHRRWHGPALMCVLEVEYPLDLWAALPVGGSSCGASVWQREYLYQVHPGRQLKLMKCHQPPHLKQHCL